jgi:hypothetical protein
MEPVSQWWTVQPDQPATPPGVPLVAFEDSVQLNISYAWLPHVFSALTWLINPDLWQSEADYEYVREQITDLIMSKIDV